MTIYRPLGIKRPVDVLRAVCVYGSSERQGVLALTKRELDMVQALKLTKCMVVSCQDDWDEEWDPKAEADRFVAYEQHTYNPEYHLCGSLCRCCQSYCTFA